MSCIVLGLHPAPWSSKEDPESLRRPLCVAADCGSSRAHLQSGSSAQRVSQLLPNSLSKVWSNQWACAACPGFKSPSCSGKAAFPRWAPSASMSHLLQSGLVSDVRHVSTAFCPPGRWHRGRGSNSTTLGVSRCLCNMYF